MRCIASSDTDCTTDPIGVPLGAGRSVDSRNRVRQWVGPIILAATFLVLTIWSWRAWPDPLVDFGRELYVPWQLSSGAVLYRDIAYFNGPFSPYFNALVFKSFGVSLTTLALTNLALLALLTAILYRWLASALDELSATVAGLVFLTAFAFAQLTWVSNYNFVCPYSHEMTHGVFLTFIMLAVLTGRLTTRTWTGREFAWLHCAGFFWGLTFLGKVEIFVASTAAALTSLLVLAWRNPGVRRVSPRIGAAFLAGGMIPVLVAFTLLATYLNPAEAWRGTVGAWHWLMSSSVVELPFYRMIAGLDEPWSNLQVMMISTLRVSCVVLGVMLLDRCRTATRRQWLWLVFAAGLFLLEAYLGSRSTPFLLDGACLLSVSVMVAITLVWKVCHTPTDGSEFARYASLIPWAVLAVCFMGKQLLRPQLMHYGFALSMPATVLSVALLLYAVPRLCASWRGGIAFRVLIVLVLVGDMFSIVSASATVVGRKSVPLGDAADRFLTYRDAPSLRGDVIKDALEEIQARIPQQATFVVLPDGVMLNYLSRRPSAIRYINFMPPEMLMFGERAIIESLDAAVPDFVVLVHKDTSEYGTGVFGSSTYAQAVMEWVHQWYVPVTTIGSEPFRSDEFGIQILARQNLNSPEIASKIGIAE